LKLRRYDKEKLAVEGEVAELQAGAYTRPLSAQPEPFPTQSTP
jgi:hypothetical protein